MPDTIITVIGNMTADPELRFTPSGAPVASFTIASTPRTFDKQTNEYKDGEPLFLRCSIWRDAAENVAETLRKGMRVVAYGKLKQRTWEKDGERRTSVELEVTDIGPSLLWQTANVQRSSRRSDGHTPGAGRQQQSEDPWGSAPSGGGEEPPF
ncbi:single-stranded DNA-binding protein [Gordonia sp. (in: high G+C Gram-positive bacteria)]|uniref:single-stranded DNA-binding protein n=1 Tax=Gordonia sp. (in: high G+C Gram-positive bacteria) TaxID=84139 RepID=UPI003340C36C